ncbi:DUF2325 domain-containing protein [Orenia marismortui]|uniref:Dihydroorotate dehydrogenase n=1 Tax=Orenia marismortui TaxID=46469 RepID=A0A4R8H2S9_9FIRM|nr:DUF2325 domain-containing protein [Orenia marismortui]TDX48948.1 hypothetical protein C7959_12313 [Orenia marismortui]
MSIVIVGGDKLGNIPTELNKLGFDKIEHISGRKSYKIQLTTNADMVLVLTDYISHNLCKNVKCKAKECDVPVLFCRRSWSCIYKKLNICGFLN